MTLPKRLIRSSESLVVTATAATILVVHTGPILFKRLFFQSISVSLPAAAQAPTDPETRLARGERLPIGAITRRTLELIPGITTEVRRLLIAEGPLLSREPDDSTFRRSLEALPGIGPTTARKLLLYFAATNGDTTPAKGLHRCPSSENPPECRPEESDQRYSGHSR